MNGEFIATNRGLLFPTNGNHNHSAIGKQRIQEILKKKKEKNKIKKRQKLLNIVRIELGFSF